MRLQLIALAVAAAAAFSPAAADPGDDQASATVRVYTDDDHLTVVSPAATLRVTGERLTTDVDVAVDAISAASVDVVTAASPHAFTEQRLEAGLGLTFAARPTLSLRAGAQVSHERDYDALRVAAGVVSERALRNTTLELRGRLGLDRATAVDDPMFSGERTSAAVTAIVTQLVDRRTVVDLTVEGTWAHGWHGSPYRRVRIDHPSMPAPTWWPEATPEDRRSLAIALRGRRAVGERWFATAIARGYLDDWEVHSATATVELRRRLSDRTLIGASARGYLQDGASFWQRRLADALAPPTYRTADRTLGPMATGELELIGDRVLDRGERRLTVAVGGLGRWYLDHVAQQRRLGATFTLSFTSPW